MQSNVKELTQISSQCREMIIDMITAAKSGHPGGSLSAIDLIVALWFAEMKGVKNAASLEADRDHFILSKGHGVPALYAVLALKGFLSREELPSLRRLGSRLQGHPDRRRLPIVEASTGSLGQGMSVAQGMAMGLRAQGSPGRVFCMIGDGELQEGQIWEAAMSAAKYKLSNLCVILDQNGGQIDGPVSEVMPIEPVLDKFRSFGWHSIDIDGHDFQSILGGFAQMRAAIDQGEQKPFFIRARTIKGKGVSFMEGKIEWHGVAPKAEEAQRAIAEIRGN